MIAPKKYIYEEERIKALGSLEILDTLPEIDFDNLTLLAAEICGTPISLVSFVDKDRQWFKSHFGLDIEETSRESSFCAHAIHNPNDIFIVEDSRLDERFHDNPLVTDGPNIVFYAGFPLVSQKGFPLGTLCVADQKPRELTKNQIRSLKALSHQTLNLLELRLHKAELEKTVKKLEDKNIELEKFAYMAAHDLKSPLGNISSLAKIFVENYTASIDAEGHEILNLIINSANKLRKMISGLLDFSKSDRGFQGKKEDVNLEVLKEEISNLLVFKSNCNITLQTNVNSIKVNKTAIEQILINLVANAIKYNDKEIIEIGIHVNEKKDFYEISVSDNGPGILKEHYQRIFQIFEVLSPQDRFGESGNGIGLATVKKIVESLGGTIYVESEIGKGTKFIFTISKF